MGDERKESLFIVAYKGRDTAETVYETLRGMEKADELDIKTAMVIYRKENGKLKLVHKRRANTWGGAALGGGLALILGAATGGLLAGAVIGGAIGGFGHTKRKETKEFLDDKLGPDDSAVAVWVKEADWEAVQKATERFGGEELKVELTEEAAMQVSAMAANPEVADAVADEVEVEDAMEE